MKGKLSRKWSTVSTNPMRSRMMTKRPLDLAGRQAPRGFLVQFQGTQKEESSLWAASGRSSNFTKIDLDTRTSLQRF